jgi:hypothetical protein
MKSVFTAFVVLACFSLLTACSTTRHTKTTTQETVQTVPADPVVLEKKTTTETESRSDQ